MNHASHFEILGIIAGFLVIGLCSLTAQFLNKFNGFVFATNTRIGYIDGLRGVLALSVFLHHYNSTYYYLTTGKWSKPLSQFYNLCGEAGVAIFFVITGFLFWQRLLNCRGQINWIQLYVSRIFRLVPLHWFSILILLGIVSYVSNFTLKVSSSALFLQVFRWFLIEMPDINNFKGTLYICACVFWTLKYEWLFYLSLFMFGYIIRLFRGRSLVLVFIAVNVFFVSISNFRILFLHVSTIFFIFFLIGAICAAIYEQKIYRMWGQSDFAALTSVSAITMLFVFLPTAYSIKAGVLILLFIFPIVSGNNFFHFLKNPAFLLLGKISFSIYILHGFLLYIIFTICFPGFMINIDSPYTLWAGMGLMGIFVVLVSYLSFSLIERPFINLGRKISQRLAKS